MTQIEHIMSMVRNMRPDSEIRAALESLQAEIKWLTQANIDHVAARVALRAEVDRLTTEKKAAAMNYEARLTALEWQKPEFWWRPFDDGSYLGPLHDDSIEEVRKLSQEWKPLFVAAGAAPTCQSTGVCVQSGLYVAAQAAPTKEQTVQQRNAAVLDLYKNSPEMNTSQERVQKLTESNQMLLEALKKAVSRQGFSNDELIEAREAINAVEKP